MSLPALCRRITEFGFNLLANDFALDARSHVLAQLSTTKSTIMWSRDDPEGSLIIGAPAKIADYIALLEKKEYSFLMHDGALIQISYTFERDNIERHRLMYFPCPFDIRASMLTEFEAGLLDLIQAVYLDDVEGNVSMRSPIRFDYAPEASADFHPASHITLNEQSCRIPVRAPMRFDSFMRFIIENFYPDIHQNQDIAALLLDQRDNECLSDHDRGRIHFTWRNPQ